MALRIIARRMSRLKSGQNFEKEARSRARRQAAFTSSEGLCAVPVAEKSCVGRRTENLMGPIRATVAQYVEEVAITILLFPK